MADGIEERLSAGRDAREQERGVSQAVGRLQRQVDALYAERRHFAAQLDQLRAAQERLEARSRSWISSLLSHDLDGQLEAAQRETYAAEDRLDDVERRFEAARAELEAVRGEQETIATTTSDYQAALDLKERSLLDAGDPRAERLREITAALERQTAVLRQTDDLITSVGWSDRALDTFDHLIGAEPPPPDPQPAPADRRRPPAAPRGDSHQIGRADRRTRRPAVPVRRCQWMQSRGWFGRMNPKHGYVGQQAVRSAPG